MRALLITLLLAVTPFGAPESERAPRREIDNVVTFARLYGVVRYFYPSDAAASLEWDRFAVHGVKVVRAARDRKELETSIEALFSPLGPGIEIGATLPAPANVGKGDRSLIAWRYLGPGVAAPTGFSPYKGKRTNRSAAIATGILDGFVTVMQTTSALPLRGKTVRLRGQVRSTPRDASGSAALWLRVDRPSGARGFFDNMRDRPIRVPEWREYEIEGPVAEDATHVAFGVMASGAITADFDAIDLAVRRGDALWTSVSIEDSGFEPRANALGGWNRAGTSTNAEISRPVGQAPEGRQFLRFSPPTAPVASAELFDSPPMKGAHVTIDLGSGLRARVRLALSALQAAASANSPW
jgi:hypothetical protein